MKARRTALLYSLVQSCTLAGVPTFNYLKDVLLRVATHPPSLIAQLTPKGWAEQFGRPFRRGVSPSQSGYHRGVPRHATQTRKRVAPRRLPKARFEELVEEALIDAYGEPEQRTAFLTMLEEHLACPFTTEVLGQPVQVERVDLDESDEIVAICRRGRTRQRIPILNLPLPSRPPAGWQWIAAYRHWARGQR